MLGFSLTMLGPAARHTDGWFKENADLFFFQGTLIFATAPVVYFYLKSFRQGRFGNELWRPIYIVHFIPFIIAATLKILFVTGHTELDVACKTADRIGEVLLFGYFGAAWWQLRNEPMTPEMKSLKTLLYLYLVASFSMMICFIFLPQFHFYVVLLFPGILILQYFFAQRHPSL